MILTVDDVVCQLLVWGLFEYLDTRQDAIGRARARRSRHRQGQLPPPGRTCSTDEPVNLLPVPRSEDTALDDLRLGRQERRDGPPADRSREGAAAAEGVASARRHSATRAGNKKAQ